MSAEDTLVTREHFAYLADHAAGDDELLTELKQAAREAGIPPIWIGAGQAALLSVLLRLSGARRVLEVPTTAPEGRSSRLSSSGQIHTSCTSARLVMAAILSPGTSSVGRSFRECTAASTSPSRKACSSS